MKRKITLIVCMLALVIFATVNIMAAAVTEFSADLSLTPAGGKPMTGKTFVKGEKIRNEMMVGNQTAITILRQDKNVTWILKPAQKKYIEVMLKFNPAYPDKGAKFTTKEIGTGKANGYDCKLIQYNFKDFEGTVVQWFAPKLNMQVRIEVKSKAGAVMQTIDYSNIKVGPQSDSLFEIPAGYWKE